jgi:hypothetical protein
MSNWARLRRRADERKPPTYGSSANQRKFGDQDDAFGKEAALSSYSTTGGTRLKTCAARWTAIVFAATFVGGEWRVRASANSFSPPTASHLCSYEGLRKMGGAEMTHYR